MQEKILRLIPKEKSERIELYDFEKKNDLFVNIYREEYSDEFSGYFVRSKNGAAVTINKKLPPAQQANVIKLILKGMDKCPSSELGVVKDMTFSCGGHCCFNV